MPSQPVWQISFICQTELNIFNKVKVKALGDHVFHQTHRIYLYYLLSPDKHSGKNENTPPKPSMLTLVKWSCWQDFSGILLVNIQATIQSWLTSVTCIYQRGNMTGRYLPPGLTCARPLNATLFLAKLSSHIHPPAKCIIAKMSLNGLVILW